MVIYFSKSKKCTHIYPCCHRFSKSRKEADPHDILTAKRFIDFYACGILE